MFIVKEDGTYLGRYFLYNKFKLCARLGIINIMSSKTRKTCLLNTKTYEKFEIHKCNIRIFLRQV